MEDLTGFIVNVKSIGNKSIKYKYDEKIKSLSKDEVIIGYFWQMTERDETGKCMKAHIHEVILIDYGKLLFKYGKEMIFNSSEVKIKIIAKRGWKSNNENLSKEYDQYETWYKG